MKTLHRALFALLLAACAPPALAWGALGHRLAASLAEDELSPRARTELRALLADGPDATLADLSTWADELRSRDPGLGRRSARWHYVNLAEDGCTYSPRRDCPGGDCVVEAIRTQARILADRRQPRQARRQALAFVVHLVADAHQPLHAGYARDRGGNRFQIRVPSAGGERGSNLHAWWDSGLLAQARLDEAQHLARLRALPRPRTSARHAARPDAAAWARESCAIVRQPGFYPPGARLPADYVARWSPVVDARLRLSGTRLARVLDAALAP